MATRKWKQYIMTMILTALAVVTSACGNIGRGEKQAIYTLENDNCTNGQRAIIETDDGYYYNTGVKKLISTGGENGTTTCMNLFYYDKGMQEFVMLCAKPECEHLGGDECAATYRFIRVIDTVMLGDSLYVYGIDTEDTIISYNLYKVTKDGVSLNKLATVLEADDTKKEGFVTRTSEMNIVIHRGYAYLPYFLQIGNLTRGFVGAGIARVNLKTGEVERLYEAPNKAVGEPWNISAVGDYVYFQLNYYGFTTGATRRYNLQTGEVEKMNLSGGVGPVAVTKDCMYSYDVCELEGKQYSQLNAYSVVDAVPIPEKNIQLAFLTLDEELLQVLIYENYLVATTQKKVYFYDLAEENYGTLISEVPFESPFSGQGYSYSSDTWFSISHGYLYRAEQEAFPHSAEVQFVGDTYLEYTNDIIFRLSIEDILAGKVSWEEVFQSPKRGDRE